MTAELIRLLFIVLIITSVLNAEEISPLPNKTAIAPLLQGNLKKVAGELLQKYLEPIDRYDYFLFFREDYDLDREFSMKILDLKHKEEGQSINVLFVFEEGAPHIQNSFQVVDGTTRQVDSWNSHSIIAYIHELGLQSFPILVSDEQKLDHLTFADFGPSAVTLYDKNGRALLGRKSKTNGRDIDLDEFATAMMGN